MNNNRNSEVAQFVMLDVGVPNLASTSEAVLTSVGDILCMSRGDHVPAVGLSLINANYQPVIKLSSTQTPQKLQKILHALNSVKNTGKCRGRISTEEFKDNIHVGIKSAIDDFETLQNQLMSITIYYD